MSNALDRQTLEDISLLSGEAETEVFQRKLAAQRRRDEARNEPTQRRKINADLERRLHPNSELLPTVQSLTGHEKRNYSVARLVRNLADHFGSRLEPSLEVEISNSLGTDAKNFPSHGGVLVPLRFFASGLDTKTDSAGGFLTSPRVAPQIVDAIRAATMVFRLGAKLLTAINANVAFPIENDLLSAEWVTENGGSDATASFPSFRLATVKPHTLLVTTSASRELMQQSSPDLEAWIRGRIGRANGLVIDAAALAGSGQEGQPAGVLLRDGLPVVGVDVNGGTPDAADISGLESACGVDVNAGGGGFLAHPLIREKLRAVPSIASGSQPLWDGSSMLGYPAFASSQVPTDLTKGSSSDCSAILFGDWPQLLVTEFAGVIELLVDKFTSKKTGMIELSSYLMVDVCLPNPTALAAIVDAK